MQPDVLDTTTTAGLLPLGSAPQRSWELVTGALRDRLGEDFALLLAEPVATEHGDRIDWHAPRAGRARRFPDLPEAEREQVSRRLGDMTGEILAEAERLQAAGDPDSQRLAEALTNAVEIPSKNMIHVIAGADGPHPVLVHWAWLRDEGQPVRGVLTGMVPRPVPLMALSGPAGTIWSRPVWRWLVLLGWILLAALLALILWLMIRPCGLVPWGPDNCTKKGAALAAAYSEQVVLEDRIAALQREVALAGRVCQPAIPILPAVETPEPVPERKGDLMPGSGAAPRRLAGLAGSPYSRSKPFLSEK